MARHTQPKGWLKKSYLSLGLLFLLLSLGGLISCRARHQHFVPIAERPRRILPEGLMLGLGVWTETPRGVFVHFRYIQGIKHPVPDTGEYRQIFIMMLLQIAVMDMMHYWTL